MKKVTVSQLASMIREAKSVKDLPSNIKVVDGTVTLSEGANISLLGRKDKSIQEDKDNTK